MTHSPTAHTGSGRTVLVTGGGGFIGRHALSELVDTFDAVYAVTTQHNPPATPRVTWLEENLLTPGAADAIVATSGPTHLLHLAWITDPASYWTSAENVRWLQATIDLANAFFRAGGQRLVSAGTCAEYDWSAGRCHETTTPLAPATFYGACKHAARLALARLAVDHCRSYASSRIFHLYGPAEHASRFAPAVIDALLAGREARLTAGEQVRDWLYVKDVAAAHVRLLTSEVSGAVNIASGAGHSLRDVARAIADQIGRADLLRFGALPTRAGDPPLLVANTERLANELKWAPRYDLKRGLSETIAWRRQRLASAA